MGLCQCSAVCAIQLLAIRADVQPSRQRIQHVVIVVDAAGALALALVARPRRTRPWRPLLAHPRRPIAVAACIDGVVAICAAELCVGVASSGITLVAAARLAPHACNSLLLALTVAIREANAALTR